MDSAICPVCGEPVAFIPDLWTAEVVHTPRGHVVTTHRPRPPHVAQDLPDA